MRASLVPFLSVALALATLIPAVFAHPFNLTPRSGISQSEVLAMAPFKFFCFIFGGGNSCNDTPVNVQGTVLAAAKVCDQQDGADKLVDLANGFNNTKHRNTLVRVAQIWMQQPRSSTSSLSMPYCPRAPRNPELNGYYQCQFAGTDPTLFATTQKGQPVGANTTIPFGYNTPVNPPGSCPDYPDGPVPDGEQLACLLLDSEGKLAGVDDDSDDDSDDSGDDSDDDEDDGKGNHRGHGKGRRGLLRRNKPGSKGAFKDCKKHGQS